ncbi:hypothetical protein F5Y05DRAFT_411906 [Hypoxylon sp. FL0543]|nr:hypothetical protein F5Y05DRAFT_411906 [Hypoxylon sp. FL0543]
MWAQQTTVPGLSPRRSACDRCKGQKLKCLREPEQERCSRCARARVECLITPGFRFRHVPGDGTRPGPRKRLRQDDQQQSDSVASAGPDIDTSLANVFMDFGDTQDPLPFAPGVTGSWEVSDNPDENFDSLDLMGNKDSIYASFRSTAAISHSNPSSEGALRPEGQGGNWDNVAPFFPANVITSEDQVSQVSGGIPEDIHIQRLSRMNLNLATLLGHLSQGPPNVTFDELISPPNERSMTPVHNVLDGTREFIDILRALSEGSSTRSPRSRPASNASISVTAGDTFPYFPVYRLTQANTSTTHLAINELASSPDVTTFLLITTSYIHITRLHLIFFAHCYEFIRQLSRSNEPSLCAIPAVDLNRLSLKTSDLRATVFVEVVNNLFERMENLLGMPQEFRVGMRVSGNDGLLSEEYFTGALRMMMSQEELVYMPEHGKGGVKALRIYIEKTKQSMRNI